MNRDEVNRPIPAGVVTIAGALVWHRATQREPDAYRPSWVASAAGVDELRRNHGAAPAYLWHLDEPT